MMERKVLDDQERDEQELLEAFKTMDKDGTGLVNMSEIRRMMRSLGELPEKSPCHDDFDYKEDTGEDEILTFEQFKKLLCMD